MHWRFCGLLLTTAVLFTSPSSALAELFSHLVVADRIRAREDWEHYSHLKHVELLGNFWLLQSRDEYDRIVQKLRADYVQSRCVVPRKPDAMTPTWRHRSPTEIVDPAVWHLNPDSQKTELRLAEALSGSLPALEDDSINPPINTAMRRFDMTRQATEELAFLALVPHHPYHDMPVHSMESKMFYGGLSHHFGSLRRIRALKELRQTKMPREGQEGRAIVSRQSDATLPTWDGTRPAFVVDPAIWYFDPRLERQEIRLSEALVGGKFSIVAPSNVAQPVPRRTYLEYLLTDAPLEVQPEMYGSVRLFR